MKIVITESVADIQYKNSKKAHYVTLNKYLEDIVLILT